ncbi:MAG TPA: hypothetical protein VKE22_01750 [Haliangiales bacterium]|nr:hypothetical protein [Haliangiales bacterium]
MVFAGCAGALPAEPSSARLYRDLQRLVTLSAAGGWGADRLEVQALLRDGLESVCRATPERRLELLGWIEARDRALGGPVEEAWKARGKDLAAVGELVELERIRALLVAAMGSIDDCPFWNEPAEPFAGRQIADDRWIFVLEFGGRVSLAFQEDRFNPAFGPATRTVVGRMFGPHWGILFGMDANGSAQFPRTQAGETLQKIRFGLDVLVPVIVRYRLVNTYVEVESGFVARFAEEQEPAPGYHVGATFGLKYTRRAMTPGLSFGIAFEQTLPKDGPTTVFVKAGARIALDFDL